MLSLTDRLLERVGTETYVKVKEIEHTLLVLVIKIQGAV